jgi:probable HAF family extracellular repeat protein
VVGLASTGDAFFFFPAHAFRTASNSPINSATDDLGTFGGTDSQAYSINSSGQVVGSATTPGETGNHAFRTAANSPIDPATDELGTLGSAFSVASGVNDLGQTVGKSQTDDGYHAFRTAPNSLINPATDDLGIPGSVAQGINNAGQVVGYA